MLHLVSMALHRVWFPFSNGSGQGPEKRKIKLIFQTYPHDCWKEGSPKKEVPFLKTPHVCRLCLWFTGLGCSKISLGNNKKVSLTKNVGHVFPGFFALAD